MTDQGEPSGVLRLLLVEKENQRLKKLFPKRGNSGSHLLLCTKEGEEAGVGKGRGRLPIAVL